MTDNERWDYMTKAENDCDMLRETINDIKQSVYFWGSRDNGTATLNQYVAKIDWIFDRCNKALVNLEAK